MARKTDEERLKELEEKIEQAKAKKQQIKNRLTQKERKKDTRRKIIVGALFEKHFDFKGEDEALKIIYSFKKSVQSNKEKVGSLDIEKVREELGEYRPKKEKTVYKNEEEKEITIPIKKGEDYKVNKEGEEEENEKD